MSQTIACRLALVTVVAVAPLAALALPWNKDMVDQPSVKPQETLVQEPENVVPVDGVEVMAKPADVGQLVMQRIQAASKLNNPERATVESIARGSAVYETHCLVCHGASGKGDGLVGLKFTPPPMDLTLPYVQQQADGQLYYTITHGSVVMPFYRDAIPAADRWHLVNYMKHGLVKQ